MVLILVIASWLVVTYSLAWNRVKFIVAVQVKSGFYRRRKQDEYIVKLSTFIQDTSELRSAFLRFERTKVLLDYYTVHWTCDCDQYIGHYQLSSFSKLHACASMSMYYIHKNHVEIKLIEFLSFSFLMHVALRLWCVRCLPKQVRIKIFLVHLKLPYGIDY